MKLNNKQESIQILKLFTDILNDKFFPNIIISSLTYSEAKDMYSFNFSIVEKQ